MVSQILKQTYPRPFLKWAGGKSRLISQYQDYFPKDYKTYYEPFLGGGAIFFYLQPFQAILTDINADLILTYRCVRDHFEELIALLQKHKQGHNSEYYYDVRNCQTGTDLEKAARFIYLNKTCFNGLYRVNSQGKFNVPVGKYKNPGICQKEVLKVASVALEEVEIKHANFDEVLNYATGSNDFVYFDPPYYPLSPTSNFRAYSNFCFDENQQIKLRDIFIKLANKGVKVMLSNSDCPFIRDLYIGFNVHTISAARSINSNAQRRGKITEILVTSYSKG
ncbi:DNA adenine methylase [Dolichospermum sp. ST_sed1]|nr:DNA adenine methylase [Dolichospermum sp. ST_sed1]MDD1428504.1 DNA adenine methylase [Dolichospermum sp. ST_sed9]MDD1434533.1 DNA adenine methylase [Dolichospermum sp. ST_sed6]MDD1438623.1 DNA adenine methylase [Dolichospermum sp. ST_sed10]MDD1443752.1 DNA adenine methylase [Dolichospermum sp. ST_sed3]MDD1458443.1 DNA adenine methylase [Dolichospermum sp. ST_sed7]MDD1463429.1 DNA adenine methylase [Dolichospermum sp. ST_sed2]MDD1469031.1 DNA adenine methylase [Dolichospermum sp. ST_sed5]